MTQQGLYANIIKLHVRSTRFRQMTRCELTEISITECHCTNCRQVQDQCLSQFSSQASAISGQHQADVIDAMKENAVKALRMQESTRSSNFNRIKKQPKAVKNQLAMEDKVISITVIPAMIDDENVIVELKELLPMAMVTKLNETYNQILSRAIETVNFGSFLRPELRYGYRWHYVLAQGKARSRALIPCSTDFRHFSFNLSGGSSAKQILVCLQAIKNDDYVPSFQSFELDYEESSQHPEQTQLRNVAKKRVKKSQQPDSSTDSDSTLEVIRPAVVNNKERMSSHVSMMDVTLEQIWKSTQYVAVNEGIILYSFNPFTASWKHLQLPVKSLGIPCSLAKGDFGEGTQRRVYFDGMLSQEFESSAVVMKVAIDKDNDNLQYHQQDAQVAVAAQRYALEFNLAIQKAYGKSAHLYQIEIMQGFIVYLNVEASLYQPMMELGKYWYVERQLPIEKFKKYYDNQGHMADPMTLVTAQDMRDFLLSTAFGHFSWVFNRKLGKSALVTDVQGCNQKYTDVIISTENGEGFSDGNVGGQMDVIKTFFEEHKCNEFCINLGIDLVRPDVDDSFVSPVAVPPSSSSRSIPQVKPSLSRKALKAQSLLKLAKTVEVVIEE